MSDYAVVNPATGETLATYPTATDAEVTQAVAAADAAYRTWARTTSPAERAELVRKVAELHRERRDTLAAIVVREMGKPLSHAEGEVDFAADIIEYYADNYEAITADAPFEILGEGTALIRRSPIGPLLGIMPWNYPYYQVARFAAPNLVLGNTIILKHAPQCPESSAAIAQMYLDAGFPEGAFVNVYATNDQAAAIIADPRVAGVSVTGSERAGSAVAALAGANLKKVALEMGGSDPFILLSTDDLDAVVEAAGRGAPRQLRAELQRAQALHRDRLAVRRVRGEVHGDHGRTRWSATASPRTRPLARFRRSPRPIASRTRSSARLPRAQRS